MYTTTLEIWVTNNLRIADLGALAVKLAPERERVGLARQASAERDQRPLEQPPIARKAAKVKLAIQSRQRFIFND